MWPSLEWPVTNWGAWVLFFAGTGSVLYAITYLQNVSETHVGSVFYTNQRIFLRRNPTITWI
jgi:hypothetical protein